MFYADVFLLQNLFMDYVAVTGTNYLLKRQKKCGRLFLAAALFAGGSLFLVLFVRNKVWYQIIAHFVLNTGMVGLCFGKSSKKQFLENWLVTYLMVILLGGGMEWLEQSRFVRQISMLELLLAVTILFSAVAYLRQCRTYGSYVLMVALKKGERIGKLYAFYDSGNQLRDPYTGKAISILSYKAAEPFQKLQEDKIRYVPYRSLGEEHGLLPVMDVEELQIYRGGRTVTIQNAALGIADDGLFAGKQYDMILNAALLDLEKTDEKQTENTPGKKIKRKIRKEAG